jgi:hypothetical protein
MRFQWECTQDPRYGDHLGIDVKAENGRLVVFGAVFRQYTSSLLAGTEYVDDGGSFSQLILMQSGRFLFKPWSDFRVSM